MYTSGIIVEVEAYNGLNDRASHAYPDKKTPRTVTMYRSGGIGYVYLVYGMHHLFNIVTNKEGYADAVLVRAIMPVQGIETMRARRGLNQTDKMLTGGPARLSQALGITTSNDGIDLTGKTIWLSKGIDVAPRDLVAATRIGVEYAGADALLPWRFFIKGNKFVSK